MNRDNDRNLPAELSDLESQLSELTPSSRLDESRLLYEAGYAAAVADVSATLTFTRTALTAAGSALVGVAATLLAMFIMADAPPKQQAQVIPHPPPAQESTKLAGPSTGPARADRDQDDRVPSSPAPAPADLYQRKAPRVVPQPHVPPHDGVDLAYSTLRLRNQLLSGNDSYAEPKSPPVSFPGSSSIHGRSSEPRSILELQDEFFQESSSHPRVNS